MPEPLPFDAAKDRPAAKRHLAQARVLLAQVADPEERRMLEADLASLKQP